MTTPSANALDPSLPSCVLSCQLGVCVRLSRTRQPPTGWKVNTWVKQGILLGFRSGDIAAYPSANAEIPYFDKDTLPLKPLDVTSQVRVVPGGSSIRDGAYIGAGVICMPPMYVNIGAYVGEGSLIDSHALVGSCAQVGRRVHVSAAAQIGGVLEPVGALPVIIEDDVLVGGKHRSVRGRRGPKAGRHRRGDRTDRLHTSLRPSQAAADQSESWHADRDPRGGSRRARGPCSNGRRRPGVGTLISDTGHREVQG